MSESTHYTDLSTVDTYVGNYASREVTCEYQTTDVKMTSAILPANELTGLLPGRALGKGSLSFIKLNGRTDVSPDGRNP